MEQKRFIIGIDLGTTNSAVSYVDLSDESIAKPQIQIFRIPQITGPGEISRLSVLPSFLYLAGEYDHDIDSLSLPWTSDDSKITGAYARDHGKKVPSRLVLSAKSWLCHDKVDRQSHILPWGSGQDVRKVSPVEASASYLNHIRLAWNERMGDDEDAWLEHQMVILTVPASFDEVARDLTVEAARLAGMPNVILLEEPLAAFYSWLGRHESEWNRFVSPGNLILVCDVGGGTTDFTLIALQEIDGNQRFERIAVGDHLILGGDNIDLTLARTIEQKMQGSSKNQLSMERWQSLCHQCRDAKEAILSDQATSKTITLIGEGRSLIAGTLSSNLDKQEIERVVLDGFFPIIDPNNFNSLAESKKRKGITEFGLPYEQEPAITKHLCRFLEQHQTDVSEFIPKNSSSPDVILFNGGSLKPDWIQNRICESIKSWSQSNDTPEILKNPEPFLAVAVGASYYGLVKMGHGVRVGSGSARSYYLGIDTDQGKQAMCIVERGQEEGSKKIFEDKAFEVLANQPVRFDLFSSSYRSGDRAGNLFNVDDSFSLLPPLQTVIQYGKNANQKRLPVLIDTHYTELGTLSIWCKAKLTDHRWQLRFELRDKIKQKEITSLEILEESQIERIREAVRNVFSPSLDKKPEKLVHTISELADRPKEQWPLSLLRELADLLLTLKKQRKISPAHESRWLNLMGYTARPGFGDSLDEHRMSQLWKLYKPGPHNARNPQVLAEWWIFWRRISGGLTAGQQRQFIQDLKPMFKGKKNTGRRILPQERMELWMAIANLERLSSDDKNEWAKRLVDEMNPKKAKPQQWWALSRLCARELLYGPADRVISKNTVEKLIQWIMQQSWRNLKPVHVALAQMARMTGDRKRDFDKSFMETIIKWMKSNGATSSQVKFLSEIVPVSESEEKAIFGESLPSGIFLHS
ncbi:molecular chaperone DnaK [Candidatus Magnetomorum sp. HK-1]|nr:molecular chaperone DnaK [Candidatus Magnetomorum sp. HK-1]